MVLADLETSLCVRLAERLSSFRVEALAFQVLVTFRTLKALAVVVVVEGLNPSVACFDRETTTHTLGREQFVPICLAVGQTVFKVECARSEDLAAVGTAKALWVELFTHGVQTIPLDALIALATCGGKELFIAVLTMQVALLFNKAYI